MSSHQHDKESGPSIETHVPIPGSSSTAQHLAFAEAAHQNQGASAASGSGSKKKKHRAGRKRKNRRQSFAAPSDQNDDPDNSNDRPSLANVPEGQQSQPQSSFYRLGNRATQSSESLQSEILLDHRYASTISRYHTGR